MEGSNVLIAVEMHACGTEYWQKLSFHASRYAAVISLIIPRFLPTVFVTDFEHFLKYTGRSIRHAPLEAKLVIQRRRTLVVVKHAHIFATPLSYLLVEILDLLLQRRSWICTMRIQDVDLPLMLISRLEYQVLA